MPEAAHTTWREDSTVQTLRLITRLDQEGEVSLADKIRGCGAPLHLICEHCGTPKEGFIRCKRKWCPYCARVLAAKRGHQLQALVQTFRWPLFVTLTMRNVDDLSIDAVRTLRRAFGKLRHRRFWKENVGAGLATIEVTNIGNGWHPHLHAVIDCHWLAIKTPRPQKGDPPAELKKKFAGAAAELEANWARCLKQPCASVKVKRANKDTILKEVVKYAVKGTDLLDCEEPIGDLIRCIERTRLMTTFGRAHGAVSNLRHTATHNEHTQRTPPDRGAQAERGTDSSLDSTPERCCAHPSILPVEVWEMWTRGWRSKAA